MRIVFAGTPEFAAVVLRGLLESGHEVAAAYTQPDRPAGRGRRLRASHVKIVAEEQGVPVRQPATLRSPESQASLRTFAPDVIAVAAYGLLLPPEVLAIPRDGCINVHASLLPRWRGAAPIQRAILAGDDRTGVSIMEMDEGLDTGAVLARSEVPILETDSAGDLHDRLAALGARVLVHTLERLHGARAEARPQRTSDARYAPRIAREEARLDWTRSARELDRVVRAMNPFPGRLHHRPGGAGRPASTQSLARPSGCGRVRGHSGPGDAGESGPGRGRYRRGAPRPDRSPGGRSATDAGGPVHERAPFRAGHRARAPRSPAPVGMTPMHTGAASRHGSPIRAFSPREARPPECWKREEGVKVSADSGPQR